MKPSDMDIRWHDRGGQGAITAAKIVANVTGGIRPGGAIIINTHKPVSAYTFDNAVTAVADVSAIAVQVGLPRAIVNTGIIGAFARATGLVEIEPLLAAIEDAFRPRRRHGAAFCAGFTARTA